MNLIEEQEGGRWFTFGDMEVKMDGLTEEQEKELDEMAKRFEQTKGGK